MNGALFFILVGVGALIGYITNYIAIRLLFRPYKPFKIGNITVFPQGVIPREKKALAKKVGEVVKKYILSEEEIKKIIQTDEVKKEIELFIEKKLDVIFDKKITEFVTKEEIVRKLVKFIEKFVSEKFPMFASFVNENMLKSVFEKVDFETEIGALIDTQRSKEVVKQEIFEFLEAEVPQIFIKAEIEKIVEQKVASFNEKTLEDMLFSLMEKHFTFINAAGAVLGGIIGAVQYLILYL